MDTMPVDNIPFLSKQLLWATTSESTATQESITLQSI